MVVVVVAVERHKNERSGRRRSNQQPKEIQGQRQQPQHVDQVRVLYFSIVNPGCLDGKYLLIQQVR